jgi:hypothetical protein
MQNFGLGSEYTIHDCISNRFIVMKSIKYTISMGQFSVHFRGVVTYSAMFADL